MGVQFPSAPPDRAQEVIRNDSSKGPIAQPAEALVSETSQSRFESWSGYQADVVFNGSTGAHQAHGTSSTLVVRSSSLTLLMPGRPRAGRVALNHEIEVRILAGQPWSPMWSSRVGGPRAGLKSRRSWFDSSGLRQAEEELGWLQRRPHKPDTWVRLPPSGPFLLPRSSTASRRLLTGRMWVRVPPGQPMPRKLNGRAAGR